MIYQAKKDRAIYWLAWGTVALVVAAGVVVYFLADAAPGLELRDGRAVRMP